LIAPPRRDRCGLRWQQRRLLRRRGNRLTAQRGTTTYAGYDAANKLLWTNLGTNAAPSPTQPNPFRIYTYNANGEPISIQHKDTATSPVKTEILDWDGAGQLRRIRDSATGTVLYSALYDGDGTRVSSTLNGVAHTFSYGAGLLRDDTSASTTTYTPGVSQRNGLTDLFFHEDWQGSTRYLTDATGLTAPTAYRHDAYGMQIASAGPDATALKWAGQHEYQGDLPLGLSHVGARQYDSFTGRFLSRDPIGFAGGFNLYAYCDNDPVNSVDPDGEQARPIRRIVRIRPNRGPVFGARPFRTITLPRPILANFPPPDLRPPQHPLGRIASQNRPPSIGRPDSIQRRDAAIQGWILCGRPSLYSNSASTLSSELARDGKSRILGDWFRPKGLNLDGRGGAEYVLLHNIRAPAQVTRPDLERYLKIANLTLAGPKGKLGGTEEVQRLRIQIIQREIMQREHEGVW
jgi:RHS repeat-associated protein